MKTIKTKAEAGEDIEGLVGRALLMKRKKKEKKKKKKRDLFKNRPDL